VVDLLTRARRRAAGDRGDEDEDVPGPPLGEPSGTHALGDHQRARRRFWPETALLGAVVLIQVGGTALASIHQPERGGVGAGPLALLLVAALALPLRHRAPRAVLAWTLVPTGLYWSLGYPRGPVFAALIVAFVQAVVVGRRRAALASLAVGFALFSWLGYLIGRAGPPRLAGLAALAAWLITLFSVAEVVRSRRDRQRDEERAREEAARRRALDERVRIARDLHDAVAHSMSLINIQAGVALHLMGGRSARAAPGPEQPGQTPSGPQQPDQVRHALEVIKASSKDALVELRSILGVLRQVDEAAPRLPTPGLREVGDLVEQSALSGVEACLDVAGDLAAVPRPTDLAAYRIVQESLTNVARHADPPRAVVRIRAGAGALVIDVVDEGVTRAGRDLPSGGNGIVGMRERAASVGGRLEAGPRAGHGFAVRAVLPLEVAP
jgi:signal transduction histidine kinase